MPERGVTQLKNGKWDGLKERQTPGEKTERAVQNKSLLKACGEYEGTFYASDPTQGLLEMQGQLGTEDAMMPLTCIATARLKWWRQG